MFRLRKILPCVLLSACVASSVCVLSACNSAKDYSEDITKLQQQIDEQKQKIESLETENKSLEDQVATLTPSDYTEEIEELQQQIDNLKNKNGDYTSEIEKLQQQIETLKSENTKLTEQANNQQLLIESLQNATSTQPKIYKVGETFTYSYQGIDYFSLTLETTESNKGNTFRIKNINMSGGGYPLILIFEV